MVSIDEAKRKLPTLVLVNGEDLTPYRADSKRIMAVLKRFGVVERHGLDEGAVDITAQVQARLHSGPPALSFSGHVLGLRTIFRKSDEHETGTLFNFESMQLNYEILPPVDVSLLVGSQVVAEMRTAIEKETGFRCSCGVAQNKMLAKLSSSLNKPSMQTCLLQGAVAEFLGPLSVRKIPGVGKQIHGVLTGMGVETIADLAKVTLKQLSERFGDRVALLLFNSSSGKDPTLVQDKGPPKSISVEDSFRNCKTMQHAVEIFRVLAPDLIRRLDEDREETGRRPKSFTVKWRVQGSNWNFTSLSTQMPLELLSPSVPIEQRSFLAVDVAVKLLSRSLQEPFHLVVLNIGAANFVSESASTSLGVRDIRSFLQGKVKSPGKELKVISKRDARANRESFKPMAITAPFTGPAPQFLTFPTPKVELKNAPGQKLLDWDVSSEADLEDEYLLSNSSEEDGMGDISCQLRLSGKPNSFKKRDAGRMHGEGGTVNFKEHESPLVQESYRKWPSTSGVELSSRFPLSPQKIETTNSCSAAAGAKLVIANTLTDQFSGSRIADNLQEPYNQPDMPVPFSSEPSDEAHRLAGTGVRHSGSLLNNPRADIQELRTMDSVNMSSSVEIPEIRTDLLSAPGGMDGKEKRSLHQLAGSECILYEQLRTQVICDKCGVAVEDTDCGRQEHADFHFALRLDKQERNTLPLTPESARAAETSEQHKVACSTPSKKLKSRNGTLDGFVIRRP